MIALSAEGGARGEDVVRRLSSEYLLLRSYAQALQQRADILNRVIADIDGTLSSLETIKGLGDEDVVLFPLGSASYIRGKVVDKGKVLVDVGAGVVVEKDVDEAVEYLRERQRDAQLELKTVLAQLQQVTTRLEQIEAALERAARGTR
ncbi:MAG: prefoldin subunit alpha [Thermoprotei archaeon]|nr:MAG: prefoldin subunit alpha [Thermoprotei archaeon]